MEDLPAEILNTIFSYLSNEDDLEVCQQVCNQWAGPAKYILNKSRDEEGYWDRNIYHENEHAAALVLFRRKADGTRFSSVRDLDMFEANMDAQNELGNPLLINRTLILYKTTTETYMQLWERIPGFIQRFGNYIWHLYYWVDDEISSSTENLSIISTLINLKSLTLYCSSWGSLNEHKRSQVSSLPLNQIRALNVLGEDFGILLNQYFSQCEQLKKLGLPESTSKRYLHTAINIEEFKTLHCPESMLRKLPEKWKLRSLSFRPILSNTAPSTTPRWSPHSVENRSLRRMEPYRFTLTDVLDVISCKFSSTLKLLNLHFDEKHFHGITPVQLGLPNVLNLQLPLFILLRHSSDVPSFFICFPNVSHLQFAETVNDNMSPKDDVVATYTQGVNSLWDLLPVSLPLEVISVRLRRQIDNQNTDRKETVWVVDKFKRT